MSYTSRSAAGSSNRHIRPRDAAREKYLPQIAGRDAARPYLAYCNGKPVGYIQYYLAAEGERLGQGLGTAMASAFVAFLLQDPAMTEIRVNPRPDNLRAIRCYAKAGFRECKRITIPDGPALMMILERRTAGV